MQTYLWHSLLLIASLIIASGCSLTQPKPQTIKDLQTFPQDISSYDLPQNPLYLQDGAGFAKQFFAPWRQDGISYTKEQATWGFAYAKRQMHGANLLPYSQAWFAKQEINSNMDAFNSLSAKAVTVTNTNMRVFPTSAPLFADPKQAGEGYPFDYNQNTGIKINTPVLISHFSKDRRWVLAQSGFGLGWVRAKTVAFVSDKQAKAYESAPLHVAVKDKFHLTAGGYFYERIKLGTIFAKDSSHRLYVFTRTKDMQALRQPVSAPPFSVVKHPLLFHRANINAVLSQLHGEKYGWGEAGFLRDCSAMTRDFFTVFGLYLPRNSAAQARAGRYVSLEDMNAGQKRKLITQKARPLRTLLYMPGHIMLYLKTHEDKIVIFHNFWGIPTRDWRGNEGRFIVGKAAITGLTPGSKLPGFDPQNALLSRLEGFSIIEP